MNNTEQTKPAIDTTKIEDGLKVAFDVHYQIKKVFSDILALMRNGGIDNNYKEIKARRILNDMNMHLGSVYHLATEIRTIIETKLEE